MSEVTQSPFLNCIASAHKLHLLPGNVALCLVMGLFLALLQFSYFFLLEAYLSSRMVTFFVALFFWLIGVLAGLNVRASKLFQVLVVTAMAAYYIARLLIVLLPYNLFMLPGIALCVVASGLAAGYFFPWAADRFASVKLILFHENNGFILGILVAQMASIFAGKLMLNYAPLAGAALVLAVLHLPRPRQQR